MPTTPIRLGDSSLPGGCSTYCGRRLLLSQGKHLGLLSTASLAALLIASSASAQTAQCSLPSSGKGECVISDGDYSSSRQFVVEGDDGDDDDDGEDGPDLTLSNFGRITIYGDQYWGLFLGSLGGDGSDERSDGGDGGDLELYNYEKVELAGSSTRDTLYGIAVISKGGDGGGDEDDTGIGGKDGGRGGDGGTVRVENSGVVAIQQGLPLGGAGIYAESNAGPGGDQDSTVGDQRGGNSGDAKDIFIDNSGFVYLGNEGNRLSGRGFAWGIGAQSHGDEGGKDNGNGGTGGNIIINNSGVVDVFWEGADAAESGGVRGIYGRSRGGDGRKSHDNSNSGGNGQAGYQVQITSSGSVSVNSSTAVKGLSGGIVAISQGGDGGEGPGRNHGGDGANAGDTTGGELGSTRIELYGTAQVVASGDGVAGLVALSRGGRGGNGEDGAHDSSGGDGGDGGAIELYLRDRSSVSTNGRAGFGALGQSIGGTGGDGGDDKALLGQTGSGGYGGDGGDVSFAADTDTTIETRGAFSSAIVTQSIGGGGGTGGDFLAVLGGAGGNGGNGGDGGRVIVDSAGFVGTYGDHSSAILAQSVAGSGGTGEQPNSMTLTLGGDGGSGGDGGDVTVRQGGTLYTMGYGSRGLVAQSLSGGGGQAATIGSGKLMIGGSGGGGGTAGDVFVETTGIIQTQKDAATGILAQSIGGGGGAGAGTVGIISVGGQGGDGGDGARVDVLTAGAISTGGDWANGVTAQSIGAGGGDGGNAFDFSVVIPSVGVGGDGGVAGDSSDVFVGNFDAESGDYRGTPTIETAGDHSYGVLAQSIGGGGGIGGYAMGEGLINFATLQIGGDAGDGSTGNDVRINYRNLGLRTSGLDSAGIVAQSIGGGGGVGGTAFGMDQNLAFATAFAVGGTGGDGGDADTVTVTLNDSSIVTGDLDNAESASDNSPGILAQSIGGGGGIGGRALAFSVGQTFADLIPVAFSGAVSVGGNGGAAGNGDFATVSLDGFSSIATLGDSSHGILAQSVGGGGGHAGPAWTKSLTTGVAGGLFTMDLVTSIGGQGASGGDGSDVTVSVRDNSQVQTRGDHSNAIVAQSIGGGGGNGGVATSAASAFMGFSSFTANLNVGGFGGRGGNGGVVEVETARDTQVLTAGGNSHGIVAQSIGGGGGTSQGISVGFAGRIGIDGTPVTVGLSESLSIGLRGGEGGDGDAVTVTQDGMIQTQGRGSIGIVAQSIGGGGGIGGSVAADEVAAGTTLSSIFQSYQLNLGLGGVGGSGGHGGSVTVDSRNSIATEGDHAIGILAQSIGGGGGLGGSSTLNGGGASAELNLSLGGQGGAGGKGGSVRGAFSHDSATPVYTRGYLAHGVVLQSIGGGGGVGGDASDAAAGRLTIGAYDGGTGGPGNDGGAVTAEGKLVARSSGVGAIGLLAQSVGGGGGLGGQGNAGAGVLIGRSLEMAVGGSGGMGGNGGDVDVTTGLDVVTEAERAYGVVAQSVGGGGGIGAVASTNALLSLAIGGQGGVAGDGGAVSVAPAVGSRIQTWGTAAHALVAQSVGGGGGIGGAASGGYFNLDRTDAGTYNSGHGGAVTVDYGGEIRTIGEGAHGIFAQSIGNGGGFGGDGDGDFAGSTGAGGSGTGGTVTVAQRGQVVAEGYNSVGIFAQSQGAEDQGQIDVTVGGSVIGGAGEQGAGVLVAAGKNNLLTVEAGGYVGATSGTAVRYEGDRTSAFGSLLNIDNLGVIDGDVILNVQDDFATAKLATPAAASSFAASASSTSAGTVTNRGTIHNARLLQADIVNHGVLVLDERTRVTGSFAQSDRGILHIDADFAAGSADRLIIDGDADLAGKVEVASRRLVPGRLAFLEVEGEASGTLEGSRLNMFDFKVEREGQAYSIAVDANFDRADFQLSQAESAAARHLQSIWQAGGGKFGELFATLAAEKRDRYRDALSSLGSGVVNAPAAETVALSQQRLDRTMSCPELDGDGTLFQEGECVWAQAGGQRFDQDAFNGADGFDSTIYTYALGAQAEVAEGWFLGVNASYDDSRIKSDNGNLRFDGSTWSIGASVKHQSGPWLFGLGLSGSISDFDSERRVLLGQGGSASGSQDIYGFGGRLRAAYRLSAGNFTLRPLLDVDVIYTHADGYQEKGAGLLNREIEGNAEWTALATPAIEAGTSFSLSDDYRLDAFVRTGVTFSSRDDWKSEVGLAGAPAGANDFTTELPMDRVYGRAGLGFQLTSIEHNVRVRAEYNGDFSSHTTRHGGMLRVSLGF